MSDPDTRALGRTPVRHNPRFMVLDNEGAKKVQSIYDGVISLRSKVSDIGFTHEDHCIECFGDVLDVESGGAEWVQIVQIVFWVDELLKRKPNANIMVHCRAGMSRSTAVAIGLMMMYNGYTVGEAFEMVHAQRIAYGIEIHPNDLVLEHFENLMELPRDSLTGYNSHWYGQQIMRRRKERNDIT